MTACRVAVRHFRLTIVVVHGSTKRIISMSSRSSTTTETTQYSISTQSPVRQTQPSLAPLRVFLPGPHNEARLWSHQHPLQGQRVHRPTPWSPCPLPCLNVELVFFVPDSTSVGAGAGSSYVPHDLPNHVTSSDCASIVRLLAHALPLRR